MKRLCTKSTSLRDELSRKGAKAQSATAFLSVAFAPLREKNVSHRGLQNNMKINLHIERLVLEGLPLSSGQAPLVQLAVQQELTRLLGSNGIAPGLMSGGAMPHASGGNMQLAQEASPRQMGTQIAQSVHEGLGK